VNADQSNTLRRQIARLAAGGQSPNAIATQLGCARSTVYTFLANPALDGRTRRRRRARRIDPDAVLHLEALLHRYPARTGPELHALLRARAAADPAGAPIPSLRSVQRVLHDWRARHYAPPHLHHELPSLQPHAQPLDPLPLANDDPFADDQSDDLALTALRRLLHQALVDLDAPDGASPRRIAQRAHVATIAATLARVSRGRPQSDKLARLRALLDDVCEEVLNTPVEPLRVATPDADGADADEP
jgi:transposase